MIRKLFAALIGFAAGICTSWLAAIAWPFALAWFMFNETEGYDL